MSFGNVRALYCVSWAILSKQLQHGENRLFAIKHIHTEKLCEILFFFPFFSPPPSSPPSSRLSLQPSAPILTLTPPSCPGSWGVSQSVAGCRGESLTPPLLLLALSDNTLARQSKTSCASIGCALPPWDVSAGLCVYAVRQCHFRYLL